MFSSNKTKSNDITLDEFRKTQLKLHNEFRKKHKAGPLVLDDELNKLSLQWAQKMASDNQLKHNPNTQYGENVFFTSSNPNEATQKWYSEIERIDPRMPLEQQFLQKQIGHFTAVVWKGTKKLGISFVKSSSGAYFIVANYDPSGNFTKQVTLNVEL